MTTLDADIFGTGKVYEAFIYYGDPTHRNHLVLTRILVRLFGCATPLIQNFVVRSLQAAGWPSDPGKLRFVEFMGGSTHGASLSAAESGRWLEGFAKRMGLEIFILTEHHRGSGRFDFHVLAPVFQPGRKKVTTPGFLKRARAVARELTEELNRERLAQGNLLTIGNLRENGEVYYLAPEPSPTPRLEQAPAPPVAKSLPTVASKSAATAQTPLQRHSFLDSGSRSDDTPLTGKKKKEKDAGAADEAAALAKRLFRELLERFRLCPFPDEEYEGEAWREFGRKKEMLVITHRDILTILLPQLQSSRLWLCNDQEETDLQKEAHLLAARFLEAWELTHERQFGDKDR